MRDEMHACGMLEFTSIAAGIQSADQMVKTADVSPVAFRTICPGKFIAGVRGDVAAVTASVEAGLRCGGTKVVDWFTLANIHPEVFPALSGLGPDMALLAGPDGMEALNALGVIETFSAAAVVLAADRAVKAAAVRLIDIRMAMGLGGKGYVLMTGDVAAVEAAVRAGESCADESGLLAGSAVIPRPSASVWKELL